jgi:hypothetical protein
VRFRAAHDGREPYVASGLGQDLGSFSIRGGVSLKLCQMLTTVEKPRRIANVSFCPHEHVMAVPVSGQCSQVLAPAR